MKYMITIVRTGCLFVEAETEEAAMHIADHQKSESEGATSNVFISEH